MLVAAGTFAQQPADTISKDTVRNTCESGHYISAQAGAGLNTLAYKMSEDDNDRRNRAGFTVDLGYQYFFKSNPHLGLATGLIFRQFITNTVFNYELALDEVDSQGEEYKHITRYKDFHERETSYSLGIPLMIAYQHELGKRWRIQYDLGIKLSSQVYGQAKRTDGEIETVGYYDAYHVELSGMANHWFMDYDALKAKFKSAFQISAVGDINFNYVLSKNPQWEISAGVYGQYVLNDIQKDDGELQFDYRSEEFSGALKTDEVQKVHPLAVGAKIGIRYRFKTKQAPQLEPLDKPTEVDTVGIQPEIVPEPDTIAITVPEPIDNGISQTDTDTTSKKHESWRPKKITINCDFNLHNPKYSGDKDLMDDITNVLINNPGVMLRVIGHTDNVGNYQDNYNLGLRRARAVCQDLILNGVNPAQLKPESRSFSEPLVPNTTPENRAKNRRVEMEFINWE